ncbi:MAG: hypothetical protein WBZ29_06260, partial [Methanocella sp.]
MLTSSHGLLRVFPVLRRPGRARTPGDTTLAAPSAAPGRVPSQALSDARLRLASITPPSPHPSHSYACEGPSAEKTLRGPRSSKGNAYPDWYWVVAYSIVGMGSLC